MKMKYEKIRDSKIEKQSKNKSSIDNGTTKQMIVLNHTVLLSGIYTPWKSMSVAIHHLYYIEDINMNKYILQRI